MACQVSIDRRLKLYGWYAKQEPWQPLQRRVHARERGREEEELKEAMLCVKPKDKNINIDLTAAVLRALATVTRANSEACARFPWFFHLHTLALDARCHCQTLMYHTAPSSSGVPAGAAAIALPLASPRRHRCPQVLHHRLPQPRRLNRRLALGHLPPLLQQRADGLVRDAIAEVLSLTLPRHSLVMRIAVPASPIHASLSVTQPQACQSRPHSTRARHRIHT